jgi:hypothetical protein
MEKLCTNKNHSYKHNEQINKQNIDNSECFGVKYVKIYLIGQQILCDLKFKMVSVIRVWSSSKCFIFVN